MPTNIRVLRTVMYIIGILALAAIVVSSVNGCKSAPAKPPVVGAPNEPLPPPDVGTCVEEIRSMEAAVAMASVAAKLLIAKDSQYGPAVNLALAAIGGALVEARAQCASGSVDGWAIAMSAFDKAFSQLVAAGDLEIDAATMPNDIQPPPPPYAFSCLEFQAIALAEEMEPR